MTKKSKEETMRIIKYIFSSGTSFIIDLLLFTLFQWILQKMNMTVVSSILLATILSRILSSLYNYLMNSRFVFNNKDIKTIISYYILVIIQMFMSAFLVSLAKTIIPINATIIKFFIEIIIFVVNYVIQKKIIFKEKR